jgi:hypothetical protein
VQQDRVYGGAPSVQSVPTKSALAKMSDRNSGPKSMIGNANRLSQDQSMLSMDNARQQILSAQNNNPDQADLDLGTVAVGESAHIKKDEGSPP